MIDEHMKIQYIFLIVIMYFTHMIQQLYNFYCFSFKNK